VAVADGVVAAAGDLGLSENGKPTGARPGGVVR